MNKYLAKIMAIILMYILYGLIVKICSYEMAILIALINIYVELLIKRW